MDGLTPAAGLVAGRYRVLEQVASDQQTITFRAEDVRSGERVAIVALRIPAEEREEAVQRFSSAVRGWLALEHPALPRVLDMGEDRGAHYVATEWPGDIALAQLIEKSGGLSVARAVDVGIQLCSLFGFFRQSGLSSSRLTAADIALDKQGRARCMPAAIIAAMERGPEGSPATDVARVGLLLREMVRLSDASESPGFPDFLAIVPKAMAPTPAERYADTGELAESLAAYWQALAYPLPGRTQPPAETPIRARLGALPGAEPRLWDSTAIALLVVTIILILGLIPLWLAVYTRYSRPIPLAPVPGASNPESVLVPDLTGLDESTARALLHQAGLNLSVDSLEYSDQVPLGKVIRQDPGSGRRVDRDTSVRVVLSQGPAKTTVPDLVGQPYAQAEATLALNNLNAQREDVWSLEASNQVMEQEPAAGTEVVPGTTVVLRVSAGSVLPVGAVFGDVARLISVEPDRATTRPGDAVRIILQWQALRSPGERYSVFVHVVNEQGVIVAQHDGEPANGARPTSTWTSGEMIPDVHQVGLPTALAPGTYSIRVGLYLPGPNERLPIVDAGHMRTQDNALIVHQVIVSP